MHVARVDILLIVIYCAFVLVYQSYIRPGQSDAHYLWMGRMATVFGVAVSIATLNLLFW
jgi:hypothetical protein